MTKKDIVEALVDKGMPRSAATKAVTEVVQIIADALSAGQNVTLRGLGTFAIKTSKEKVARDISNNKQILVPPCKKVKFVISNHIKKELKI